MIRGGNPSDDLDSLLTAEFQTYILQLELLYFSASGHGEFLDKENVFRNFVTGNFSLAEFAYIKFIETASFMQDNECPDSFSVFL